MTKPKLTKRQIFDIMIDDRAQAVIAKEFGFSIPFISKLKKGLGSKKIENVQHNLSDYEYALKNWHTTRKKYIQRMLRLDKSKTREQHETVFVINNPEPEKDDFMP